MGQGLLDVLGRWASAAPPPDEHRWVVLDVESSGLDPRHDRLLSVAAVAVRVDASGARIALGDSIELVLRQPVNAGQPDKANILLHGIGVGEQQRGAPAEVALRALAVYVGSSPLLAFHAAFDRELLDRACQAALGRRLANRWLDLAPLAEVLHPQVEARALDEWMAHFGIQCAVRHQAAADTLAECELLQRVWPRVASQCDSWRAVQDLAAQQRWIARA